jgi:hypothetical protein
MATSAPCPSWLVLLRPILVTARTIASTTMTAALEIPG